MNSEAPPRSISFVNCTCIAGFQRTSVGGSCFDPKAECPIGSYKDHDPTVGFQCISCIAGKYNLQPGGTDESACESCESGKYSNTLGASACSSCPEGKANSNSGSVSSLACIDCDPGTYSAAQGASFCTDCEAGKYVQHAAAVLCINCHANSHSAARSAFKMMCICNIGYSGPDGTSCEACQPGSYKMVNGSSECAPCFAGSFSSVFAASICTKCTQNAHSPSSSISAQACTCNIGYSGPNGGPCTVCLPGTYKEATGSSPCTLCPAGTFGEDEGQISCDGVCPAHSFSSPGSSEQTDCRCNTGYTGLDGEVCIPCKAGHFKPSIGSAQCTECAAGKFSGQEGAEDESVCTRCSSYSDSVPASTHVSDCICNAGYSGPHGGTCTSMTSLKSSFCFILLRLFARV